MGAEVGWAEITKRGFIRRWMSISHCLHCVVVVLAKRGTPQLDDKFQGEKGMGRDENEPFRTKELAALVEGVDVEFEYCEAEVACKLLCWQVSC